MKKQTLLLMAGGILALASCNNEQANTGMSQAQVDSAVNARVEEIRGELMAQNDSLINALAQWKADSMIAAMKGAPAPAKTASAKPKPAAKPTEKPSTPAPNTATGKNSQSQQNEGKATGKNSQSQQNEGKATGKKSQQQSQ